MSEPYQHPSVEELKEIYRETKTIAAVGASSNPSKASHRIPAYLAQQGYEVIPVNPRGGELFGERVRTSLAEITEPVDVVDVFRPSSEAPEIAEQAAAINAKVLWLQAGIVSNEAADIARAAGMTIIMDMCMGTTHAQLGLDDG
jgi:predicted CoA-binding protein